MSRGDVTTTRNHALQTDHEIRWLGRVAGLLYLVIIACGFDSEVYNRGSLYDDMDTSITAANISTDSAWFKAGYLSLSLSAANSGKRQD